MAGNHRKFFPRTAPKKCRAGQIKTLLRKDGKQRREKHISCQPLLAEDVHIEETRPVPSRMWKLCLRGRAWSPLKANGNQHFATLLRRTLRIFPWFVDPLVGDIVGVLWSDLWTVYIIHLFTHLISKKNIEAYGIPIHSNSSKFPPCFFHLAAAAQRLCIGCETARPRPVRQGWDITGTSFSQKIYHCDLSQLLRFAQKNDETCKIK